MSKSKWTDEALIKAIEEGGSLREVALEYLCTEAGFYESTAAHILQYGGHEEDAEDVFQESLIVLDRTIREGRFLEGHTLKAYFVAVAKQYWYGLRRTKKRRQEHSMPEVDQFEESIEMRFISEERKENLAKAIEQTGERCKMILELYQLQYSSQEIADIIQLSSAEMAKKETYRCRLKLKSFLETHPAWKNLLT